jgi:hypothetical protein
MPLSRTVIPGASSDGDACWCKILNILKISKNVQGHYWGGKIYSSERPDVKAAIHLVCITTNSVQTQTMLANTINISELVLLKPSLKASRIFCCPSGLSSRGQ